MFVLEYKACSIEYFMDNMTLYELNIILSNLNYCVKNDWEQTREIMWSNLAAFSKKKIKPSEVMKFPWEEKSSRPKVEVTKRTVEQMAQVAETNKAALLAAGII